MLGVIFRVNYPNSKFLNPILAQLVEHLTVEVTNFIG